MKITSFLFVVLTSSSATAGDNPSNWFVSWTLIPSGKNKTTEIPTEQRVQLDLPDAATDMGWNCDLMAVEKKTRQLICANATIAVSINTWCDYRQGPTSSYIYLWYRTPAQYSRFMVLGLSCR